ncbi:MAG: DUF433 domain-containing protein [Chloroflexi bacterium]|nr:DUF433 domain-containing protein [Chloroflexota bacterium]
MAALPRSARFGRIARNPRVCGGEPTIKGTRIPVRSIVIEYQRYHDLEWVRAGYPQLDVPTIQEALTFYEAHREEIDRSIAENEEEDEGAD